MPRPEQMRKYETLSKSWPNIEKVYDSEKYLSKNGVGESKALLVQRCH